MRGSRKGGNKGVIKRRKNPTPLKREKACYESGSGDQFGLNHSNLDFGPSCNKEFRFTMAAVSWAQGRQRKSKLSISLWPRLRYKFWPKHKRKLIGPQNSNIHNLDLIDII